MSSQLTDLAPEANSGRLREAELLFALSRRHELPFSVIALVARGVAGVDSSRVRSQGDSPDDGAWRDVEERLAPCLRATDVFAQWGRPGYYMVFCSGTGPAGAGELSNRITEGTPGLVAAAGHASFGDDGLTLEDLVARAWSKVPGDGFDVSDGDGPADGGALRLVEHGYGRARVDRPRWRRRLTERIKRLFDLGFVGLLAPFWLTTFGLVAAAIKLSNPSAPVLFVQMRTGRGGRRFPMYKFRTMVPDAEALKERLRDQNELHWPDFKIKRDPRITRIGRVLRKSSLDELPQLLNVIRGDMSLVGPRPTSFEPGTYAPWQTARLEVQPGITGLWQVEGRAATRFDERIRIELDYVERQSLRLDLWILLRTVPAVVQMRGGH